MARNDKFWEFLKIRKNIFVHEGIFEPITKQPFLPQLLEIISNLDYEVQNIGILILSIHNSFNIESNIEYKNLTYDIENIQRIIIRSTELVFPTDAFFGISDIYRYEFIILFPSVSDFRFNLVKFKEICKDISMTINENLKNFPYDFSYASDVVTLDINNPRKILSDIDGIRQNKTCISDKSVSYFSYKKSIKSISKYNNLKNMIKLKNCYDTARMQVSYQYFSLKKPFEYMNVFKLIIQDQIDSLKKLKDFLSLSQNTFHNKISAPLLFPYMPKIDFSHFIRTLSSVYVEDNIIIMIDENSLIHASREALLSCISSLPPNFSIGIDNCFISNEILNILSQFNFSILAFSESIIRNLYMFQNRMKVISGLIIFLDQIMVPSLTFNIQSEAEFQIINDLRIKFCSGKYPDYIKQHVKN